MKIAVKVKFMMLKQIYTITVSVIMTQILADL